MKYLYETTVLKSDAIVIDPPESAPDILDDFDDVSKKGAASKVSEIAQSEFTFELSYMNFKDKVSSWGDVKYMCRPGLYRLFIDSDVAI